MQSERRNPTISLEIHLSAMHGAQSPSGAIVSELEMHYVISRLVNKNRDAGMLANDCTEQGEWRRLGFGRTRRG
jgi:hypothetical protein